VAPPEGISAAELEVWQLHAADAVAAGTLTPSTARSFVRLVCDPQVRYNSALVTLEKEGWTYQKATEAGKEPKTHPEQQRLEFWYRRVVDGHREFKLSPFGKAVSEPAKVVDPFAEFEAHA
jgi:hypothetical protein